MQQVASVRVHCIRTIRHVKLSDVCKQRWSLAGVGDADEAGPPPPVEPGVVFTIEVLRAASANTWAT